MYIGGCTCGYSGNAVSDLDPKQATEFCPACNRIYLPISQSGKYYHPTDIPKVFRDLIDGELAKEVDEL